MVADVPSIIVPLSNRTGGGIPIPSLDWANGQVVAFSGTAASTTVYSASNDYSMEICANGNCWYSVGSAPTAVKATAGSQYLPAGATRYVYVQANWKISVVQDSASGTFVAIPALAGPIY